MFVQKLHTFSVTCKRLWKISVSIGLLVIVLTTQCLQVSAENTETLFNIYGLTLGGPIRSDIEEEINSAEQEILDKTTQQNINDIHNAITQEYIDRKENEIITILSDVSVYQSRNDTILSNISSDILDRPISELLQLDNDYKSNVSNIDALLSVMNGYTFGYTYRNSLTDLSEVEERLMTARQRYTEAIDAFDLGDVTNIKWIMPNDKYITSPYGYRVDPLNSNEVRFHAGTDYRAPVGTPIGALFNGKVISCGWSNTIGYFVTVECGENVKYLICHCSELCVQVGQEVKQYDVIAYSGGTGTRCTGPHLHLALYLNGVTYDVDELFK